MCWQQGRPGWPIRIFRHRDENSPLWRIAPNDEVAFCLGEVCAFFGLRAASLLALVGWIGFLVRAQLAVARNAVADGASTS